MKKNHENFNSRTEICKKLTKSENFRASGIHRFSQIPELRNSEKAEKI